MANDKRIFNWQLYVGIILVVTGGLFLADQLLGYRLMAFYWPVLVLIFGLTFFIGMLIVGKSGAGLAIPGAVISTLGVLLFIQNTFNLWITWAYAWALLIAATGLGLLIMNGYLKREGLRRASGVVIGIGLTLFVGFGVLFEVILNIAGTDIQSGVFLGVGLVLLGLFVVFSRLLFARKKPVESQAAPQPKMVDAPFVEQEIASTPGEAAPKLFAEGDSFTRLHFKSVGEVFLIQGDTCDLRIEGDPELVRKVSTQLEDDQLKITYAIDIVDWTGLQWTNAESRLRYYISVKDLEHLHMGGAGVIRAEQLSADHLRVHHGGIGALAIKGLECQDLEVTLGGLGEIRFEGQVESQVVELSGGGSYLAADLRSQKADVVLTGAGTAQVWAEAQLIARVSGAGNILYKGDPHIDQSVSGLGGVKPL